jgi:hypothetical protein
MTKQPLHLRHPMLRGLYEFWKGYCAVDSVAGATDIDPASLRPWIGNLLIMDVIEGDNFIYSYYGDAFQQAFGDSMVGKSIELLPPEQRDLLHNEYDRVRREREPLMRTYTADFNGRVATWERLVLPLTSTGETVDKLLVAAYQLPDSA